MVLFCLELDFLEVRIELDRARVQALFPGADLALIEDHLNAVRTIATGGEGSGPIGKLSIRERFHWLVAPRSTVLQVSAVHTGLCESPERAIEQLMTSMVRPPAGS